MATRPRSPIGASPRTLQALRYPIDACEQGLEEFTVLALRGTPATQQIDLHEIHGIHVRIAQLDRALQGGLGIEQAGTVFYFEHGHARQREFIANGSEV